MQFGGGDYGHKQPWQQHMEANFASFCLVISKQCLRGWFGDVCGLLAIVLFFCCVCSIYDWGGHSRWMIS